MTIAEHQQRIGDRIAAHPDLTAIPLTIEAAVPNVVAAVMKSLAQGRLNIVVASGPGEVSTLHPQALIFSERFIVTVGQAAGVSEPTLAPIQIVDRLLPWLHGYPASDAAGSTRYLVRRHDPLPDDGPISGHQLTLEISVGIRIQS